jgi:hypothetical protein
MIRSAAFAAILLVAACGQPSAPAPEAAAPDAPAAGLSLTVTGSATHPDEDMCAYTVLVANRMDVDAVNLQVAYTARTEGFGTVSDYMLLGDYPAGLELAGRIFVSSAPCAAIRTLKLTRAVCTVAPVADPPASCAADVTLHGGGVVEIAAD